MLEAILKIAACATLNRARGCKFFDYIKSTVGTRLASMLLMAIVCAWGVPGEYLYAMLFLWGAFMLWCSPAWNNYWSGACGFPTDVKKKAFVPVDWAMKKIRYFAPLYEGSEDNELLRRWGLVAMTLRQLLIVPAIIGLAILAGEPQRSLWAVLAFLMGATYYLAGKTKTHEPITWGEYGNGGIIAIMCWGVTHGV